MRSCSGWARFSPFAQDTWADSCSVGITITESTGALTGTGVHVLPTQLDGFAGRVRVIDFSAVIEARGQLVEIDYLSLPFQPQRMFLIRDVPVGTVRGGHAHRRCEQLLLCLRGGIMVEVATKSHRARVSLNRPTMALYLTAGVWAQQTYEELDSELLVLASLPYDPASYISEPE